MTATPPDPITPVRCTVTGCPWAVHGIPDRYVGSRNDFLRRHLAEDHKPTMADTDAPHPPHADRHADIRARHTAATGGTWYLQPNHGPNFVAAEYHGYEHGIGDLDFGDGDQADADREFVLHAHDDMALLLAANEELGTQLAGAEAELNSAYASLGGATGRLGEARADNRRLRAELEQARAATEAAHRDAYEAATAGLRLGAAWKSARRRANLHGHLLSQQRAARAQHRDQVLTEAAELLIAEMPWHRLCADLLLAARTEQPAKTRPVVLCELPHPVAADTWCALPAGHDGEHEPAAE